MLMLDNGKQLTSAMFARAIGIRVERAERWLPHFVIACQRFGIAGTVELASFFAQVAHESALLSVFEENLNYSAEGLANTWDRYSITGRRGGKPNMLANSLSRKPQLIANDVYANRMGNGDKNSGDGWKYRGRGPIQLTGKTNYRNCGNVLSIDLVSNPDLILQPANGAMSAAWFWSSRGLDRHDDDMDVLSETRIINGGTIGLKHRRELFNQIYKVFSE